MSVCFFVPATDIVSGEKVTVSPNVVRGTVALMKLEPNELQANLKDNYIISCAYWVLNITTSSIVNYNRTPASVDVAPTAAGQQGVGFVGLAYLMGLVKEPTLVNAPACKKRWAAGLAGVSKVNALVDAFTDGVWKYIVDKCPSLYSHVDIRRELMARYLELQDRDNEPAIARAVLSQLDLIYTDAYLKSVNLMHLFTSSGSRVVEIPCILEEIRVLEANLAQVKTIEGSNYSKCRLIDNNKYPSLNHSHYPNLYAATLEWARRSKKVQKNYLGSKALIDQAIKDIVRRVLKMTSAALGSGSLSTEQVEWLRVNKGYIVPSTPLSEVLTTHASKRPAADMDSGSSDSESEDEEDRRRSRKAKSRRH